MCTQPKSKFWLPWLVTSWSQTRYESLEQLTYVFPVNIKYTMMIDGCLMCKSKAFGYHEGTIMPARGIPSASNSLYINRRFLCYGCGCLVLFAYHSLFEICNAHEKPHKYTQFYFVAGQLIKMNQSHSSCLCKEESQDKLSLLYLSHKPLMQSNMFKASWMYP